jgi:hypothetical protein
VVRFGVRRQSSSGDGAFEPARLPRRSAPSQSGVAPASAGLPPQSKIIHVNRCSSVVKILCAFVSLHLCVEKTSVNQRWKMVLAFIRAGVFDTVST